MSLIRDFLARNQLDSGESTLPRQAVSGALQASNGNLRLTYLTARKTESVGNVRVPCNTAQVGATLCRIGVYSVATNGDIALIGSTPNDTALWASASTSYTKALSASFTKYRGVRYAVGLLVVGTSTAPAFWGLTGLLGAELGQSPRITGIVTGQTDLPASVTAASIGDTGHVLYSVLLP